MVENKYVVNLFNSHQKELALLDLAKDFKQIIDKLKANGVVLLVEEQNNEMIMVLRKDKEEYRIRGERIE